MRWVLVGVAFAAGSYQILALVASLTLARRNRTAAAFTPPVSILKPARGADQGFYEAIRSNAAQDYPEFEILFGVSRDADPAMPAIQQLARDFPTRSIQLIRTAPSTPNAKVGVLDHLARRANGPILLIADSDILVPAGYLSRVVAPLADERVGLVTCAYRARAESWPARFEALGVATDFGPSTLVAPFLGVDEFALGSTMAIRKTDLARIGGFAAVADYLADDYQLGRMIHSLGLRCVLSSVIVETHLSGSDWSEVWRHQVRWARTIRVSRGGGYAGLPITHATLWAILLALVGLWPLGVTLLSLRFAVALIAGSMVFASSDTLRLWWLIPFRDLWATAVWIAGLFGSTVDWGGERLRLTRDGRIVR